MFFWWIGGATALLGGLGAVSYWMAQRRTPITYPPADTLVIDPDADLIIQRDQNGTLIITRAEANSETSVAVGQRTRQFEGAVNFRDIGGYPTNTGQTVRWGQIYRAGRLSTLTDSDWRQLADLGVQLVCDLRSADEIKIDPDHLPEDITYAHTPMNDTANQWERLFALLFNPMSLKSLMRKAYTRTMIDDNAAVFGHILTRLAQAENRPAIVHCTAGKDRTGITTALLLLHLGVPDEIIIADYTLSNRDYDTFRAYTEKLVARLSTLRISVDDLYPLLTADADTMRLTIDHIRSTYGDVQTYLTQQALVSQDVLDKLRADLLE